MQAKNCGRREAWRSLKTGLSFFAMAANGRQFGHLRLKISLLICPRQNVSIKYALPFDHVPQHCRHLRTGEKGPSASSFASLSERIGDKLLAFAAARQSPQFQVRTAHDR